MELTERLAQARKARGLSQVDAAERLNVSRQAISRWETGVGTPSLDSLIQMSQLYGVSLNELVYGPETAQPQEEMPESEAQPERPAVRGLRRRRSALQAAVLAFAAVGILVLGVCVGFWISGAREDAEISSDDLTSEETITTKGEFDLLPWE